VSIFRLHRSHEGRTGQCEFLLFIFISAFSFFISLRSHLETVSDYEGLATHFGFYLDTVSDYEGLAIHFSFYLDTVLVSDYEGLAITVLVSDYEGLAIFKFASSLFFLHYYSLTDSGLGNTY
jgi:hypothetical protein